MQNFRDPSSLKTFVIKGFLFFFLVKSFEFTIKGSGGVVGLNKSKELLFNRFKNFYKRILRFVFIAVSLVIGVKNTFDFEMGK